MPAEITRYILFAVPHDAATKTAPGVDITDPRSPLTWDRLDAVDNNPKHWAEYHGLGNDDAPRFHVLPETGQKWWEVTDPKYMITLETSGLDQAFTVTVHEETADFLTNPGFPPAANGMRPERMEDGRILLPKGAVAFLADECTPDDDGHISVIDGKPVMWIGGDPIALDPA